MKPRGSESLFAMRLAGINPHHVWVDFGLGRVMAWQGYTEPVLRVLPTDPIDRLDLRCLVDLDVYLQPEEWTDRAAALYERMQDLAKTIHVVSMSFEPEMGWCWHRQYGRRELGELGYVHQLEEVQAESGVAEVDQVRAGIR